MTKINNAKRKFLCSFTLSQWSMITAEASRRGVSASAVIREAVMDMWERRLYGNGLFGPAEEMKGEKKAGSQTPEGRNP